MQFKFENYVCIFSVVILFGIIFLPSSYAISFPVMDSGFPDKGEPGYDGVIHIRPDSSIPTKQFPPDYYQPYKLVVALDTIVRWQNDDQEGHTVTSGAVAKGSDGLFNSGIFVQGENFKYKFEKPGEYDYFCQIHPWMEAKIVVLDENEFSVRLENDKLGRFQFCYNVKLDSIKGGLATKQYEYIPSTEHPEKITIFDRKTGSDIFSFDNTKWSSMYNDYPQRGGSNIDDTCTRLYSDYDFFKQYSGPFTITIQDGHLKSSVTFEKSQLPSRASIERPSPISLPELTYQVPSWIKSTAGFWVADQISDSEFVSAIQFLIKEGILVVPQTASGSSSGTEIPEWIKTTTKFWSNDQISDSEFVNAIQFLIKEGIIILDES